MEIDLFIGILIIAFLKWGLYPSKVLNLFFFRGGWFTLIETGFIL